MSRYGDGCICEELAILCKRIGLAPCELRRITARLIQSQAKNMNTAQKFIAAAERIDREIELEKQIQQEIEALGDKGKTLTVLFQQWRELRSA